MSENPLFHVQAFLCMQFWPPPLWHTLSPPPTKQYATPFWRFLSPTFQDQFSGGLDGCHGRDSPLNSTPLSLVHIAMLFCVKGTLIDSHYLPS